MSDFSGYRPARDLCFCKTYNNPQWGSLSENRSANVWDYCFFSLGAEFGLCLSFVLHFVHDVAGRFHFELKSYFV